MVATPSCSMIGTTGTAAALAIAESERASSEIIKEVYNTQILIYVIT